MSGTSDFKREYQNLTGVLNENVVIYLQGERATIKSMNINADGELIVILDTGVSVSLGVVRGDRGDTGKAAGFGEPIASVIELSEEAQPTVAITASGDDDSKVFNFVFGIPKGDKGDTGTVYTPFIDAEGNLSWSNNGGLENPATINIKGEKGDRGERGYRISSVELKDGASTFGVPGTYDTYVLRLNNSEHTIVGEFTVYNGMDGDGAGDMVKSVYDSNGDGIVDKAHDAELLDGHSSEYFAVASSIPKNTSDLNNDSGYITESKLPTKVSDLANDNNFATITEVDSRIAGIVDSAPETLNTLNELSAALNDDSNFASTVMTEINKKVSKTCTINGHPLSNNIVLTAEDIGIVPMLMRYRVSDSQLEDGAIYDINITDSLDNIKLVPPHITKSISGYLPMSDADVLTPLPFALCSGKKYTLEFNKEELEARGISSITIKAVSGNIRDGIDYDEACETELTVSSEGACKVELTPSKNIVALVLISNDSVFSELENVISINVSGTAGWSHGRITAYSDPNITFSEDSKFVGAKPVFSTGKQYEFDVLDGVWAFAEVVTE